MTLDTAAINAAIAPAFKSLAYRDAVSDTVELIQDGPDHLLTYESQEYACNKACGECNGHGTGFELRLKHQERVVEILDVYINPHYRNNGWGRATVRTIEQIAERLQYERVRIVENARPAFWSKCGYVDEEKRIRS